MTARNPDRQRRLVVFDIDGTLTRTARIDEICFLRSAESALGLRDIESDWDKYRDATDAGIIADAFEERRGRPPLPSEIEAFITDFVAELESARVFDPDQFVEVAGAASFLRHLTHLDGWFVSMATGSWVETARLKLRYAAIPSEGVPLATCSDARSREEIVRLSVDRAGAVAGAGFDRIVMVGDGPWDVRTAARLGFPFVGIDGNGAADRLRRAGADVILPDYTNLDAVETALSSATAPRS